MDEEIELLESKCYRLRKNKMQKSWIYKFEMYNGLIFWANTSGLIRIGTVTLPPHEDRIKWLAQAVDMNKYDAFAYLNAIANSNGIKTNE